MTGYCIIEAAIKSNHVERRNSIAKTLIADFFRADENCFGGAVLKKGLSIAGSKPQIEAWLKTNGLL